jgi:RNA polymerase sigma-70 factor (ECF subfamily)
MGSEAQGRDEVVKAAFRYRDALLGYAFSVLRDWTLAEDAVQDAFIVVMNKWGEFRPGTSVFLWVRQIVHYKIQETLRARARKASPLEEELLAQVASTVETYLDEELAGRQTLMRKALQRCMSVLNPRALDILSGFYANAESCEEIAQSQGRSVNAVRLSLSRLRRQLHDCMTRQLPLLEARG